MPTVPVETKEVATSAREHLSELEQQLDKAKATIKEQATSISNLDKGLTKLTENYQSLYELHSPRLDKVDERQVWLRDRTRQAMDSIKEKQVIQTAINNHTLKSIEKTEKDVFSVTLQIKGWHGHTTPEDKRDLIKHWCSYMEPQISANEYMVSTEDHKGKPSRVVHVNFDWANLHMRFLKTVQKWEREDTAKDKHGSTLSINSLQSTQESLRQVPFKFCLSVTDQAGYQNATYPDWENLTIIEQSSSNLLVRVAYDDSERTCLITYTQELAEDFSQHFDAFRYIRFFNETTLYQNMFEQKTQEVMNADSVPTEAWKSKRPRRPYDKDDTADVAYARQNNGASTYYADKKADSKWGKHSGKQRRYCGHIIIIIMGIHYLPSSHGRCSSRRLIRRHLHRRTLGGGSRIRYSG